MTIGYSYLSQEHLKEAVNLLGAKFSQKGTNLAQSGIDLNGSCGKMLKIR
jgi:hypothetical protein